MNAARIVLAGALALAAAGARADCLLEEAPDTTADNLTALFPNWKSALAGEFNITVCTDGVCPGTPACNITGLTVFNYGTANGTTDITAVTFSLWCSKALVTPAMTYA